MVKIDHPWKVFNFLIFFMVYGAKTNLGQFGILIRNGTPSLNWGHKPFGITQPHCFLCHDAIFGKVSGTYILLINHKINNMLNLWLDLDCKIIYISTKYLIMNFWSWKIWTTFQYAHFCACLLFRISYGDSIMIHYNKKNTNAKTFLEKP
jgi:hypothetical protein